MAGLQQMRGLTLIFSLFVSILPFLCSISSIYTSASTCISTCMPTIILRLLVWSIHARLIIHMCKSEHMHCYGLTLILGRRMSTDINRVNAFVDTTKCFLVSISTVSTTRKDHCNCAAQSHLGGSGAEFERILRLF